MPTAASAKPAGRIRRKAGPFGRLRTPLQSASGRTAGRESVTSPRNRSSSPKSSAMLGAHAQGMPSGDCMGALISRVLLPNTCIGLARQPVAREWVCIRRSPGPPTGVHTDHRAGHHRTLAPGYPHRLAHRRPRLRPPPATPRGPTRTTRPVPYPTNQASNRFGHPFPAVTG
jgi:hypothetical protein